MAWFYNKEVMDKAGVNPDEVRTWDDFYEAAKKVRATGSYITSDSGDAGFFDSMTWLAGATPFETGENGTSVKINLTGDDKVQSFIDSGRSSSMRTSSTPRPPAGPTSGTVA